jgi:phage baseplate assembly protein W
MVNGRVKEVEQDSDEHVMSCLEVILRCPIGFRDELPDFGWAWPEFRSIPIDLSELEASLRRWEPRATLSARDITALANYATRNIVVEVSNA